MMTSRKTSTPTLRFDPPRSGWLGITVSSGKQKTLVNTFPDFPARRCSKRTA